MLVRNAQAELAIVIRHDGENVRLVPMKSGRLTVNRRSKQEFNAVWRESEAPLMPALSDFLAHAARQGASAEVVKGLEKLALREQQAISKLF
ncbi:hypothetical protein [Quatrionicoccus australiensis]|uniref:hypothetical protein n=1 Tax=Quatrionicoccus australiensis TaxID=138118 RepID=UPI001CFA86F3|nr:hypothetical protein [Quatrionicoccus australiensis]MCB4359733.1 hypothetical protein [Quatrionicoccus australiensis]